MLYIVTEFVIITWSFPFASEGNEGRAFAIGRNKGDIIVARSLDAETTKEYKLTVSITDGVHIVTAKVMYLLSTQYTQIVLGLMKTHVVTVI